jgi:hypothetical protein
VVILGVSIYFGHFGDFWVFWLFKGFQGHFGYFGDSWGVLVILGVLVIFRSL